MPDFMVLRAAPQIFTAATPKAAIELALQTMPEYADADGSFTTTLWVDIANGQNVNVTVTVVKQRTLTVAVLP